MCEDEARRFDQGEFINTLQGNAAPVSIDLAPHSIDRVRKQNAINTAVRIVVRFFVKFTQLLTVMP